MLVIEQLIGYQSEKMEFINAYMSANELLIARAEEKNFTAIKELMEKKQGLVTAIDVVDQKIIQGIARLKEETGVTDLAALDVVKYPELRQLKIEAGKVLKAMVALKSSDESISTHIDAAFEALKTSVKHIDRNKLYYYTKQYFDKD